MSLRQTYGSNIYQPLNQLISNSQKNLRVADLTYFERKMRILSKFFSDFS